MSKMPQGYELVSQGRFIKLKAKKGSFVTGMLKGRKEESGYLGEGTQIVYDIEVASASLADYEKNDGTPVEQSKTKTGDLVRIPANVNLDRQLSEASIGDGVHVVFTGKEELSGGKSVNIYEVGISVVATDPAPTTDGAPF